MKSSHPNRFRAALGPVGRVAQYLPLLIAQNIGRQKLQRTPEPAAVMDEASSVADYERAMETQLSIAYAIGLQFIYQRLPNVEHCGRALDLACGTGHFTLALARHFGFQEVTGVDLSEPMIAAAKKHASDDAELSHVDFRVGDVTQLSDHADNSVDVCCFNQAAHHMPDLAHVAQVLAEADRVTKPDGLVLMTDLVRLRTRWITETYVRDMTADYVHRGLSAIRDDFRNSMFASWTLTELRQTEPNSKKREWTWFRPLGLPSMGVAVGCSHSQQQDCPTWVSKIVPPQYAQDLRLVQWLLARA